MSALAVALKLARSSRFWCGGGVIAQRPKKWRAVGGFDSLALFSGSKLLFSGDIRTIIFLVGVKKNSPAVVQG